VLAVLGFALNDASRWVRQQLDTTPLTLVAASIDPFRSLIDETPVTILLPAGDAHPHAHDRARVVS
jgi:hypothetical protein